ncbi:MAG: hypothetical protein J6D22_04100 [Pyramidobacter sp.]|nr:hypothetical protein [Pyramidobacter sp.]MBQ8090451.1 hypothetical protein [Pyramidobacter sp.]
MAKGLRSARRSSWKFSHALVMFFIVGIMSLGLLSMLRSDSQALDAQVTALQERLTACEKECRDLEREVAAMMSPKAVHVYAAQNLGMTQVHVAGAIRVDVAVQRAGMPTAALANAVRGYQN